MSIFLRFALALALAVLAIFLAVVLGDYGPWYLSWILGTGFMILVAALGGILYEVQEEAEERKTANPKKNKPLAPRELEY